MVTAERELAAHNAESGTLGCQFASGNTWQPELAARKTILGILGCQFPGTVTRWG